MTARSCQITIKKQEGLVDTNQEKQKATLIRAWGDYLTIMRALPLARALIWACGGLIGVLLILVALPDTALRFDLNDAIQNIFQILSVLIAALIVIVTIVDQEQRTRKTACLEIYQRLESESIELFRFDVSNSELAVYIWSNRSLPTQMSDEDNIRLTQYLAQILNLFEMAVRFRRDDIMPHDVFGSWVIWMNDLCSSKNFCAEWRDSDLRWNYIPELRDIIDGGLTIHHDSTPAENESPSTSTEFHARRRFFQMVADRFDCDVVRSWFGGDKKC